MTEDTELRNDSPCLGCGKRTAACHSTCADYPKWAKELAEQNARIRAVKYSITLGRDRFGAATLRNDIHSRAAGLRIYK